jgi:hypothetical protein
VVCMFAAVCICCVLCRAAYRVDAPGCKPSRSLFHTAHHPAHHTDEDEDMDEEDSEDEEEDESSDEEPEEQPAKRQAQPQVRCALVAVHAYNAPPVCNARALQPAAVSAAVLPPSGRLATQAGMIAQHGQPTTCCCAACRASGLRPSPHSQPPPKSRSWTRRPPQRLPRCSRASRTARPQGALPPQQVCPSSRLALLVYCAC